MNKAHATTAKDARASMRSLRSFALLLPLSLLPQDPVRTSFAVLAGFDWTAGMKLPDEVTKLDNQKVQVGGFQAPRGPVGFTKGPNSAWHIPMTWTGAPVGAPNAPQPSCTPSSDQRTAARGDIIPPSIPIWW